MTINHVQTIRGYSLEPVIEDRTRQARREARRVKARRYASSFKAMLRKGVAR